jgi:hypothetical protein
MGGLNSIRGGARCVVGRIGTRGISMGASAVKVGRWTLSESIAFSLLEVWNGRVLEGDLGFVGEEGADKGIGFPVRTDAGAIVDA